MPKPRATWFCVDLEANGPVPGLYDMVSLGAVVVTEDADGVFQIGETFYVEIKPTAPRFNPQAAAIHGLDMDRLRREGEDLDTACERLAAWVSDHTLPDTEPVFVGHNAPFDWSFVAWSYAACERPNPFGYKGLCTKSLATGVLGVHWLDSNKDVIAERLDLPAEDHGQKHRADYDAQYQAEILVGLLMASACVQK